VFVSSNRVSPRPEVTMSLPATRETAVVKAVLQYLQHVRGWVAWRSNSGALKAENRLVRFGTPGQADVLGVLPGGRLLAVECKRPGGKTTALQRAWLDMVASAGGLALVVDGVESLARQLAEAGY
jgi:hypothetical protein